MRNYILTGRSPGALFLFIIDISINRTLLAELKINPIRQIAEQKLHRSDQFVARIEKFGVTSL